MDKHSIADVLEHYGAKLPYKRNGWVKILCCFHDDSHASAVVNFEENSFKCFACGVSGDSYDIIMDQERLSFVEAVKFAKRISPEGGDYVPSGRSRSGGLSSKQRANLGRRGQVLDRRS